MPIPRPRLDFMRQAFSEDARQAQSKVVEMVRNAPLPESPAEAQAHSTA
jgi:hypothetical protein